MLEKELKLSLTFDDVLLLPGKSDVMPDQVDVSTRLTSRIHLNIPLLSAAMDTVTESGTAIAMALEGGIGIIHRNMSIEAQALEVDQVKKAVSGMILKPITLEPEESVRKATQMMERYRISGVPIVRQAKLVGILTNRDLRFVTDLDQPVMNLMTSQNLITVPVGTTLEESKELLHKNRIEKLLVVDDDYRLMGLITIKDIEKTEKYPNSCKDEHGRLRVGAAVGTSPDTLQRVAALIEASCDVIVVDTAHGHSSPVARIVERIKKKFPDTEIIAGNVATQEGALSLVDAGASAIKVGIGPGSICTTRIVAGVGVPQITAIYDCAQAVNKHDIPVVADGGIKYSGDITKAMAAGAESVMIGSLFAGTQESPGEQIFYQGRSYKLYRGMGSIEAMKKGSKDRYGQGKITDDSRLVPEGIEGRVPYKGPISDSIYQLIGGLRSGMGYTGSKNIQMLRTATSFIQISPAGMRESHVHDVIITREAPNYRVE